MENHVPVEEFGEDHIRLLLYIDEISGRIGNIDRDCLRCNPRTHHMLMGPKQTTLSIQWDPDWGTKLKGYRWTNDPSLILPEHDDWDCLFDLENAGLVDIVELATGEVRLTLKGLKVAREILKLKEKGIAPDDMPITRIAL